MLAAVGHPVTRLHRSAYAGLTLDGLEPGAWRELTAREVELLRTTVRPPALTKPMRSYIASSVGSLARRAFSAPTASSRCSSRSSARNASKRSRIGVEQRDDRLADGLLEVAVARAVEALLERRRPARRWRRS